jgi:hypothetical protein
MAFKLKSGNTSSFKNLGSSPMRQEKHFLEKKPTIPMEEHKGGDPNYKSKPKPETKLKPLGENKKQDINKPPKAKIKTKTKVSKGDVLQTVLVPQINPKKSRKVIKHYSKKAIKKGKEVIKKSSKYLNKGSGTIPKVYSKVKKYLKSDA